MERPNAPKDGFSVIFRSNDNRYDYSLIGVAPGTYFRMEYQRVLAHTDLSFEPVDVTSRMWVVMGELDTNTYHSLGLPVQRARRVPSVDDNDSVMGDDGPLVTEANLQHVRSRYGVITPLGTGPRSGTPIYNIELALPEVKIEKFLKNTWNLSPGIVLVGAEVPIEATYHPTSHRVLPQKIPVSNTRLPRLAVFGY